MSKKLISDAMIEKICEKIAGGETLNQVCTGKGMPTVATVRSWNRGSSVVHKRFQRAFALANQEQADFLADEILEIVDGTEEAAKKAGREAQGDAWGRDGKSAYNKAYKEEVETRKLRVDARKWIASKRNAGRYGSAVEITGSGGGPIQVSAVQDLSDYTSDELQIMAEIQRAAKERRESVVSNEATVSGGNAEPRTDRGGAEDVETDGKAVPSPAAG